VSPIVVNVAIGRYVDEAGGLHQAVAEHAQPASPWVASLPVFKAV